jgi:hypothetical protein
MHDFDEFVARRTSSEAVDYHGHASHAAHQPIHKCVHHLIAIISATLDANLPTGHRCADKSKMTVHHIDAFRKRLDACGHVPSLSCAAAPHLEDIRQVRDDPSLTQHSPLMTIPHPPPR